MRYPSSRRLLAAAVLVAVAAAAAPAFVFTRAAESGPPSVPVTVQPGFPAPPVGAVVYSRRLGSYALALGALPQKGAVLLQASVLGPVGTGVRGLDVSFRMQGATQDATSCGAGCYRATLPTSGRPRTVEVDVGAAASGRWRIALPAAWPPRNAGRLVARADRVWRSLRSLSYRETLASGPGRGLRSTWRVAAPNRVAYEVQDGAAGVIVGGRRWDRSAGETRWIASPQTPVTQPVPFWTAVADAHVLGAARVHGRPAWRISFFDPGTPAWFEILLDRRSFRTLDLHMITTAHFMHDVYGAFNAAPPIRPPR